MRGKAGIGFVPVLAVAAAISMALAVAADPASSAGSSVSPSQVAEGVPAFAHVFLIIGENTTYSHLSDSNAPYLLGTVRPHAAWLSNYYAVTHWSQANYR